LLRSVRHCSSIVDLRVPGADAGRRVVLEDGTKFLGILAWSLWLGLTAHDVGTSVIRDLRQGAATSTPVRDGAATSTPVRDRISAR
jgi:hypothetical protein